jgi:hypothetical protein
MGNLLIINGKLSHECVVPSHTICEDKNPQLNSQRIQLKVVQVNISTKQLAEASANLVQRNSASIQMQIFPRDKVPRKMKSSPNINKERQDCKIGTVHGGATCGREEGERRRLR